MEEEVRPLKLKMVIENEFLSFWERVKIVKTWFKKESNDSQIAATSTKSTILRLDT